MGPTREGKSVEGEIMTYTNEDLIARYLYLRGKKDRARKRWQAIEAGRNGQLEVLATELMARMTEQGEQNVKTSAGTAYRTTSWSVTTKDKLAFVREIVSSVLIAAESFDLNETSFPDVVQGILDSDALELLDARPVKEAALAYLDQNKVPPPGINIEGFYEVHVRKA